MRKYGYLFRFYEKKYLFYNKAFIILCFNNEDSLKQLNLDKCPLKFNEGCRKVKNNNIFIKDYIVIIYSGIYSDVSGLGSAGFAPTP